MSVSKYMHLFAKSDLHPNDVEDERQVALEYLADAWNEATQDGVETEALAHAALFAALASLVQSHGEEAVADLATKLATQVRDGEYSLDRTLQ